MNVIPTSIEGVMLIEPVVYRDERGHFQELWQRNRYIESGLGLDYVQDNLSHSKQGTLRGLHYQISNPQGKLIQVLSGTIFDVAVDLRKQSPTFGKWFGVELSANAPRQIYIAPGMAHGFLVLSESADVLYKCTDFYDPKSERTLIWSDPAVGIEWPLKGDPILSEKDLQGSQLAEAETF